MMRTSRFTRAGLRSMTARWPGPRPAARALRCHSMATKLDAQRHLRLGVPLGKLHNRPLSPSIANVRFCRTWYVSRLRSGWERAQCVGMMDSTEPPSGRPGCVRSSGAVKNGAHQCPPMPGPNMRVIQRR